jgi:hypothetical protein
MLDDLERALVPVLRLFRHEAEDDLAQLGWQVAARLMRRRCLLLHVALQDLDIARASERRRSRHEVVEDDAERVEVRAPVDLGAQDRFGRNVVRSAEDFLPARDPLALHEAEVDDFHAQRSVLSTGSRRFRVDEDVLRLDVGVHVALAVDELEPAQDLNGQAEEGLEPFGFSQRELLCRLRPRDAVDELRSEKEVSGHVLDAKFVRSRQVGMPQRRRAR